MPLPFYERYNDKSDAEHAQNDHRNGGHCYALLEVSWQEPAQQEQGDDQTHDEAGRCFDRDQIAGSGQKQSGDHAGNQRGFTLGFEEAHQPAGGCEGCKNEEVEAGGGKHSGFLAHWLLLGKSGKRQKEISVHEGVAAVSASQNCTALLPRSGFYYVGALFDRRRPSFAG